MREFLNMQNWRQRLLSEQGRINLLVAIFSGSELLTCDMKHQSAGLGTDMLTREKGKNLVGNPAAESETLK